jgi:hypothetical protein
MWVLDNSGEPLTLDELSRKLALNYRFVAYMLVEGCQGGAIDRLEGGRYARSSSRAERREARARRRAQLEELYDIVRACEAEWRLDDRLDFIERRERRLRR